MRKASLVIPLLISVASCGFYTSGRPSVSTFIRGIPKDLLDTLENNEQQAGQFVCAVLEGDIPGAFETLATELATDVWEEIQTGFEDVTSFIGALPTLAPEILDNIISDGEDAVSVIEELFTNPGGALTIIEGDVTAIISDVESVATGIWNDFTCFFRACCVSGTTTTSLDPLAILSSSCNDIMAAATTTYSPTDRAAASSTTYPSAKPTYAASPSSAVQTSMTVKETLATTAISKVSSAQPTAASSKKPSTPPTSGRASITTTATTLVNSLQTTSTSSQTTQEQGSGNTVVPSDGTLGFVLQAWAGFLTCFVILISVVF